MKTYYSAEDPENLIDAAQSAILLVEQTKNDIMQATEDAIEYGERQPSSVAIDICTQLSTMLAQQLALSSSLKWAAFSEDEGGLSLVIQSLLTDRRLSFKITSDGDISVVQIDENMETDMYSISLSKEDELARLGTWVIGYS